MKIKIFLSIAVVSSPLFSMDEWSGLVPSWGERPTKELSPGQQRAAWHVTSASLRPAPETFWYHRMYQPHKEALANARLAYKEAGIHHYVPLRPTHEGLKEASSEGLRHGIVSSSAHDRAIYPGPITLQRLVSKIELERILAEYDILHEHEHWNERHVDAIMRFDRNSEPSRRFNYERLCEYRADLGAFRRMPTDKLLKLRQAYWSGKTSRGGSMLHPTGDEHLMMINEVLASRKTGEWPDITELPSWESFSARNKKV